ncbi:amidohydrolase family protein, partial [Acinetobacter baumannii]|uniref:amidohydrolase family protein n=1 Tax=Acinetobacter baumannii TaxID=470 RepID=UPI0026462AD0
MIDVLSGKIVDHPAVTIVDGRITGIADARTIKFGGDVKHIDLGGKTILPGLIDMHVHLTGLAEIGGYRGLQYTDSFWGAVGVGNAKKTLEAGFTSVRNVGSSDFQDVGLREAIDGGWVPGPRITTAGYAIGATGGHCDN